MALQTDKANYCSRGRGVLSRGAMRDERREARASERPQKFRPRSLGKGLFRPPPNPTTKTIGPLTKPPPNHEALDAEGEKSTSTHSRHAPFYFGSLNAIIVNARSTVFFCSIFRASFCLCSRLSLNSTNAVRSVCFSCLEN